jgi:hypothetical protein
MNTPRNRDQKSSPPEDPIAFLVRFTRLDFEQFREGDWLNLRDDLAAFERAGPSTLTLSPADKDVAKLRVTRDLNDLRTLQVKLLSVLLPIALRQSATPAPSGKFSDPASAFAFHQGLPSESSIAPVRIGIADDPGMAPRLVLRGNYFNLLCAKAALLLIVERGPTAQRLRACPECETTVFIRVRKQRYCSRPCVNKANMRTWLSGPKGQASHRKSSQRSYAKRVRSRTSANVKIGGRVKR